jgi:hemerythrin superfamily protein
MRMVWDISGIKGKHSMTNNPIEILKTDHQTVEELFAEFEELDAEARPQKREVVDRIIGELTLHAEMEETICYPSFKEVLDAEDIDLIDEAYVEHGSVKQLIEQLKVLDAEQPEFDANMEVLMEQVRHHVEEEEDELLPAVEEKMAEEELGAMGDAMIEFKETRIAV